MPRKGVGETPPGGLSLAEEERQKGRPAPGSTVAVGVQATASVVRGWRRNRQRQSLRLAVLCATGFIAPLDAEEQEQLVENGDDRRADRSGMPRALQGPSAQRRKSQAEDEERDSDHPTARRTHGQHLSGGPMAGPAIGQGAPRAISAYSADAVGRIYVGNGRPDRSSPLD